jgi:hypothetical protein
LDAVYPQNLESFARCFTSIEDIEPNDRVEKVYKPDIIHKPDILYKKPGYNPL